MSNRRRRLMALVAALGAGVTFQFQNGCKDYYALGAVTAVDFCSILNCTGGSFFNFCAPVQLLVDCPQTAQN